MVNNYKKFKNIPKNIKLLIKMEYPMIVIQIIDNDDN